MGFFDSFFDKEKKEQKRYQKMEKTLTNMFVQPSERSLTIQTLVEMETDEAVRVLLTRYREAAPNVTVDLQEKQQVHDVLIELARNPKLDVVGTIVTYLHSIDRQINWPLKALTDCVDLNQFTDILVKLLEGCSTDYVQDPQKKQELILRAAEFKHPEIAKQLLRFHEDMNETVRFHTIESLLSQDVGDDIQHVFRNTLINEESLRIVQKLAAAFAEHREWKFSDEEKEGAGTALPDEYGVHKDGYIYLRR